MPSLAQPVIQTPPKIRILLAEDHGIVRDGLCAILGQEVDFEVVAEAANGEQAADLWRTHRPDVTLMDLQMPVVSGVDAILMIRAMDARAKVIVLTTFDGEEDIYRGIRAGAKSYLLKDARRQDLLQCIREVHLGKTWVPPAIAAKLAERIMADELTARESEVLNLLAKGKSNREIGNDLFISEGTVKAHMKAIFAKLNVLSRTEAIRVASRRGMIRLE